MKKKKGKCQLPLQESSLNLFQGCISYSVQRYEAAEPNNLQTAEITLLYIRFKKRKIVYINAAPHYHEDDSYFKNKQKNPYVGILHAYLKYSECKVLKKSQRAPLNLKEEY